MPATMATVVMTMGRARLCPASSMASRRGLPARISSMAKSTRRMEFFATMPMSIRIPITTGSDNGRPVTISASTAPPKDSGRAERIVIGWNTRTNSSTRTASTISTPAPMARAKFSYSSFMNSVLPVSTRCTPSGRCFNDGRS